MREWRRAFIEETCGHCRKSIPVGKPLFVMTLRDLGVGRRFLRCEHCAGEAVPTDLPTRAASAKLPPLDMSRLHAAMFPLLKEREPREEG